MTANTATPRENVSPPLTYRLAVPSGAEDVTGYLLGYASSQRIQHTHRGDYAAVLDDVTGRREHCGACRWFEVRIIREVTLPDVGRRGRFNYVVHTQGSSAIPGDKTYCRLVRTKSALEVIELLTIRRQGGTPSLPGHSARAITQAADRDDDLYDAWINRAVA